jgi:hypothetical protein
VAGAIGLSAKVLVQFTRLERRRHRGGDITGRPPRSRTEALT